VHPQLPDRERRARRGRPLVSTGTAPALVHVPWPVSGTVYGVAPASLAMASEALRAPVADG